MLPIGIKPIELNILYRCSNAMNYYSSDEIGFSVNLAIKKRIARLFKTNHSETELLADLAGAMLEGRSAISLKEYASRSGLGIAQYLISLSKSEFIARKGFVIDEKEGLLFPRRIWDLEQAIADLIAARVMSSIKNQAKSKANRAIADEPQVIFDRLVEQNFFCIYGGPGTGKSYVLAHIIKALAAENCDALIFPKIVIAAPSNKAKSNLSSRVSASFASDKELDKFIEKLEFKTVSRLLGMEPTSFRPLFNKERMIDADWLIIDEASMISLEQYYFLLNALPSSCQLILAGDPAQLPAVRGGSYFSAIVEALNAANSEAIYHLQLNKRQQASAKNLSKLLALIAAEDHSAALALADAEFIVPVSVKNIVTEMTEKFLMHLSTINAENLLNTIDLSKDTHHLPGLRFNIITLSFNRYHPKIGSNSINAFILKEIAQHITDDNLFNPNLVNAMPVIIKNNYPALGIFNGDSGYALKLARKWYLFVEVAPDYYKAIALQFQDKLWPAFAPSFATTVHEAQGSEYDRVILLLDLPGGKLNSRELLYTAASRAKADLVIHAEVGAFAACLKQSITAVNGLAAKLSLGLSKA